LPIEPPLPTPRLPTKRRAHRQFIFEPKVEELLAVLLPRYVETRVYQLLLEATASEFGARMTAMSNATKNAGEQIDILTFSPTGRGRRASRANCSTSSAASKR
jgi:F-type H+-transporting ATPase subunit gamma